jgi:hypothetical protein
MVEDRKWIDCKGILDLDRSFQFPLLQSTYKTQYLYLWVQGMNFI